MPLTSAAIKSARQSKVRSAQRAPYKTHMKTMMRKLTEAAKAGKTDEAVTLLPLVYKSIDMAAKKHLIHKKTASRKKASMAKLIAKK